MANCGSRSTYQRGCRCLCCRVANASYQQGYRAGEVKAPLLVDVAPVVAHLRQLASVGVGTPQVARLAGVSRWEVRAVRSGRQALIREETATRLLAVRPVLAPGAYVRSWDSRRLIHGLTREDYTLGSLARLLGLHVKSVECKLEHVRVSTALRVRAMHDAVMAEGPEELTA